MSLGRRGVYTIVGDPVPLFRARPNYHSRVLYDSQKNLKMYWKLLLEKMHGKSPMYTGPLRLEVLAQIELPHARKDRDNWVNTYHLAPPDSSNLLKFVEDCAQGVLFKNDCTIADARCIKIWHTIPKTIFIITEIPPLSKFDPQELGL